MSCTVSFGSNCGSSLSESLMACWKHIIHFSSEWSDWKCYSNIQDRMGKIKCVKSSTLADILGLTCKKKRRATLQFLNYKNIYFNRKIIAVEHMQVTNPELRGKLCRGGHRIRGHSRWWLGLGRAVRARGGSAGGK